MIPAALRSIDVEFAALWPRLVSRQGQYVTANGKPFQGLSTHAVPPKDGESRSPDRNEKPRDKPHGWDDFMTLPSDLPYALKIDEYVTPKGERGWAATLLVEIEGRIWTRRRGVGPENWDRDWTVHMPIN